jgi:hypothetical protein
MRETESEARAHPAINDDPQEAKPADRTNSAPLYPDKPAVADQHKSQNAEVWMSIGLPRGSHRERPSTLAGWLFTRTANDCDRQHRFSQPMASPLLYTGAGADFGVWIY